VRERNRDPSRTAFPQGVLICDLAGLLINQVWHVQAEQTLSFNVTLLDASLMSNASSMVLYPNGTLAFTTAVNRIGLTTVLVSALDPDP